MWQFAADLFFGAAPFNHKRFQRFSQKSLNGGTIAHFPQIVHSPDIDSSGPQNSSSRGLDEPGPVERRPGGRKPAPEPAVVEALLERGPVEPWTLSRRPCGALGGSLLDLQIPDLVWLSECMLFLYCVCLKYSTFGSRPRIWAFAAPDGTEPAVVESLSPRSSRPSSSPGPSSRGRSLGVLAELLAAPSRISKFQIWFGSPKVCFFFIVFV